MTRSKPDELAVAADDYERLAYAAHAARVKRDLLIRRARRSGLSLRQIEARTGVSKDTVARICDRPEPTLHARKNRGRPRDY